MDKYKRLSAEERWEIIQPIVEGKSTISKVEKQNLRVRQCQKHQYHHASCKEIV